MSIPYSNFSVRNPKYDAKYWKKCRAVYSGGRDLLNKESLKDLLPKHKDEDDDVYQERCKRAYYIPYPGEIVDAIVSSLTERPLTFTSEPSSDSFYGEFLLNVTRGSEPVSFNTFLKEQIQTALICKTAWTMVDFNKTAQPVKTLGEQDALGGRRAFLCSLAPESVIDWEEDKDGKLLWVLVRDEQRPRKDILSVRDTIIESFLYITATEWKQYQIEYPCDKVPADDAPVPLVDEATHTFGEVPISRLDLANGLWALGKIESIAVAHFNKRNALSWAEYCSLFPVPVAYLAPSDPLNSVTDDENRAVSQKHGPSYMRVMAEKDRMEYFGPDHSPFEIASADLDKLRDEMHRVLYQMALSVDNSGAALQRSAESKAIDRATAAVVLAALGAYVRKHAVAVLDLVQRGRRDNHTVWTAHGMETFDDTTLGQQLNEALMLESIQLPSATFQSKYKFALAKKLLHTEATEEDLKKIQGELDKNITQELVEKAAKAVLDEKIAKSAGRSLEGQNGANSNNEAKAAGRTETKGAS